MINVNLGTAKNESIQHETIKNYLCNFLRTKAKEAGRDNYCDLDFISWRINRNEPCWGVWKEYGFFTEGNWDIINANDEKLGIYFEGDKDPTDLDLWESIKANNKQILYIADIAIQHKGGIIAVFEIVAYNPPSQEKLHFYLDNGISYYAVNSFKLYDTLLRKGSLTEEDFTKEIAEYQ